MGVGKAIRDTQPLMSRSRPSRPATRSASRLARQLMVSGGGVPCPSRTNGALAFK